MEVEKMCKLSISPGNKKMGAIPSVSLPPIVTCPAGAPCAKKCYAAKLCRIYKNVKAAYNNNLNILNSSPVEYWQQVRAAAKTTKYFRYHVSGDIPDIQYLAEMVVTAEQIPDTMFLAFTKQYNMVNDLLNSIGHFPDNLKIIFSEWGNIKPENPHNLPTAAVIFKFPTAHATARALCTITAAYLPLWRGLCAFKDNRRCW